MRKLCVCVCVHKLIAVLKDCFVLLQIRACFQADRTFWVSHTVNIASLYLCRSLFYCSQLEIQHSYHAVATTVGYWSHSDSWDVHKEMFFDGLQNTPADRVCFALISFLSLSVCVSTRSMAIFVFPAHAVAGIPLFPVTANRPGWWCHHWRKRVLPSPRLPVQPARMGQTLS